MPLLSEGLKFILNADDASYSVTGIGDCTDTNIEIPSTYHGKPVTSIGDGAFYDCRSITGISIPNSITSIGDFAFCHCASFKSITIPNSVANIDNNTFDRCDSLMDIHYNGSASDLYNLIKDLHLPYDIKLHLPEGECTVGELEAEFDRTENVK